METAFFLVDPENNMAEYVTPYVSEAVKLSDEGYIAFEASVGDVEDVMYEVMMFDGTVFEYAYTRGIRLKRWGIAKRAS